MFKLLINCSKIMLDGIQIICAGTVFMCIGLCNAVYKCSPTFRSSLKHAWQRVNHHCRRLCKKDVDEDELENVLIENHNVHPNRRVLELERQLEESNVRVFELERQLEQSNEVTEDLRNRLSSIISSRINDNNPEICDLGDPYRATKLAEISKELYDNEWTDAFDHFTQQNGTTEDEAIKILLDILLLTYTICKSRFDEKWRVVMEITGDGVDVDAQDLRQKLKARRKLRWESMVPEMLQAVRSVVDTDTCLTEHQTYLSGQAPVNIYLVSCVQLCLHMVLQDPGVVWHCPRWKPTHFRVDSLNAHGFKDVTVLVDLGESSESREAFDRKMYKEYTKSGKYVEFYVWPAMLVHENGNLLHKGVAQGC